MIVRSSFPASMFPASLLTASLLAVSLLLRGPSVAFAQSRTPVLVELFTSEGCSSCPPADALLARLDHEQPIPTAEVIVLGEHVDYWDLLGWRDRFSAHLFAERQSSYATRFGLADVYTPQMVVAGRSQINGADAGAAARAIVQAARAPGVPLRLTGVTRDGREIAASLSLSDSRGETADLFAAMVIPLETTNVRSGENGGRTLRHVGVVQSLSRVGSLTELGRGPIALHLEAPTKAARLVVFAQSPGFGPVIGAVSIALPGPVAESVVRAGK